MAERYIGLRSGTRIWHGIEAMTLFPNLLLSITTRN